MQTDGRDDLLLPRWLRPALYLGVWTALGFVEAYQSFVLSHMISRPLDLEQCLALSLTMWYTIAALAPLLIWLSRQWPVEDRRRASPLVALVGASAGLAMFKVALDVPVERFIRPDWPLIKGRSDLE